MLPPSCGATCVSNCVAKAMCGINSIDGQSRCALNLCCSNSGWCGTSAAHCLDPGLGPCQQGFGSCELKNDPACPKDSALSSRRRIGYYQGWNTHTRACDRVWPRQLNTRNFTHLFYAYARVDPTTFHVTPAYKEDIPQYHEFTALKRNGVKT